ncbi:MAG TPA: hypothetical protein VNT81_17785 [Vicinamibacterales bacterium]|nr:hypothetical protein [Vicinamibacterales bacterium]
MVFRSGRRWALACAICAVFLLSSPAAASAQSSINFNGGASIDPTQVYAGVSWESPDIGGRFRIRPGIDGGFGDGLRLGTINLDLMVKFPLGASGWTLLQGGGPVISLAKYSGPFEDVPLEVHAGGSYLFGFQHDSGFFTEFRVGGGGFVPQLKLGIGWSVELK